MTDFEKNIGRNIREVRLKNNLSQERLAGLCHLSNTTLSAYENGHKTPGLTTIARIAKQLHVSIDRLYYGDENISFLNSESDDGKKIVNAVYLLWKLQIIDMYDDSPLSFVLKNDAFPLERLIRSLNEFERQKKTYKEPEQYLEMLKNSVAEEING